MKRIILLGILPSLLVLVSACKKDDSTTTTPSLAGLTISSLQPYVAKGTAITITPNVKGIYASDGTTPGTIGMYWQVNTAARDTLTRDIEKSLPEFTYTMDTLGTYVFYCYAFCSGYYNASSNQTVIALDPKTAVTGLAGEKNVQIGTHSYRTINVGGLTWMADNLWDEANTHCYMSSDVTREFMGSYYTWNEAQTACPEGWHLPSPAEWDSLGTDAGALMADALFQDNKMWEYWPTVKITNSTGFNAIPTGYIDLLASESSSSTTTGSYLDYAAYWTSEKVAGEDSSKDKAVFRYIYEDDPVVHSGTASVSSVAMSVRCVK